MLSSNRSSSGTLEAATDSQVSAQVSGQIVQILKREGDRVKQGEVIVRLDDTSTRQQLENARLSLQSAEVNLRQSQRQNPEARAQQAARLSAARISLQRAQQQFESNQRLFSVGGIAQTDLQNSRSQLENARADLEAAQANLAQTNRAVSESLESRRIAVEQARNQVGQLETSLSRTQIRAPFAGKIAELNVDLGEYLNTGGRVFRIVDENSLRVAFTVSPADANSLKVGSGLTYLLEGRRYQGRVQRSAQSAGSNRLVQLYGRFVGGQDLTGLTAGSSTQVSYTLALARGILAPTRALQSSEGQTSVFVIDGDKILSRPVQVLGESGGKVALGGLSAGTQIVFPVPGGLQDGENVLVVGGQ
jgi:multidrug efflux pump subunit AcrA (membrane-fusion protein)